jgi:Family of unknown function (DUF5681)
MTHCSQRKKNPRSLANLKPFVAGRSGNPGGKSKALLTAVLRERLTEQDAAQISDVLIAQAKAGNLKAVELILDRLEGRPLQRNENSGPDGGPQRYELGGLPDGELKLMLEAARKLKGA